MQQVWRTGYKRMTLDEELKELINWWAVKPREFRAANRDYVNGMSQAIAIGGQFVSEQPAGRNDPCPCGSGQKYKRCCL